MDLTERVAAVQARIVAAGGDPARITIVGAKPPTIAACQAAVDAGVVHLGENRAQELLAKAPAVTRAHWHFIGRLQTNKVRLLAPHVELWESIDRTDVADEVAVRAPTARVLVQVNISDEAQKGGCRPEDAVALVAHARERGLAVLGVMGIGPLGPPEAARPGFRCLREIADDLELEVRSMGMTADLEVAVEEGSTMVRVGTALFGPRPPRELPTD